MRFKQYDVKRHSYILIFGLFIIAPNIFCSRQYRQVAEGNTSCEELYFEVDLSAWNGQDGKPANWREQREREKFQGLVRYIRSEYYADEKSAIGRNKEKQRLFACLRIRSESTRSGMLWEFLEDQSIYNQLRTIEKDYLTKDYDQMFKVLFLGPKHLSAFKEWVRNEEAYKENARDEERAQRAKEFKEQREIYKRNLATTYETWRQQFGNQEKANRMLIRQCADYAQKLHRYNQILNSGEKARYADIVRESHAKWIEMIEAYPIVYGAAEFDMFLIQNKQSLVCAN